AATMWHAAAPPPDAGRFPDAAAGPPSRPPRSGRRSSRSAELRWGMRWSKPTSGSRRRLRAPEDADGFQLAGHGAPGAGQLVGDLAVSVAFQLPDCHLP